MGVPLIQVSNYFCNGSRDIPCFWLAGKRTASSSLVIVTYVNVCFSVFLVRITVRLEFRYGQCKILFEKTKLKFTEKVYLQPLQMIFLYLSLDTESKRC